MKLSNLTFIVTDDCNFNCTYCFQKKEKITISHRTIHTAVDFFYPFFNPDQTIEIGFYGGEPLLAFDRIRFAVQQILKMNTGAHEKKFRFTITTNASLLTDEILIFLARYRFRLIVSFDGLAQALSRGKSTPGEVVGILEKIRRFPAIELEINSVFQPSTVHLMLDSIKYMIEQTDPHTPDMTFTFDTMQEWPPNQLEQAEAQVNQLRDYLDNRFKKSSHNPVRNFQPIPEQEGEEKNTFQCSAGSAQMAITPKGDVWGCFLFHDFFKARPGHSQSSDFSFGSLDEFIQNHTNLYPQILVNYMDLRQDFYKVRGKNHCFLCESVNKCMICPLNAAYSTNEIGTVSPQTCQLEKIKRCLRRPKPFL